MSLTISSPIGPLGIVGSERGLHAIHFATVDPSPVLPIETEAAAQLNDWFAGKRRDFQLLLAPEGTDFQKKVWNLLQKIPFGETRSYGELANALGQPGAARAIGLANHHNPLPLLIPCHRVIGSNGKLVGYAGGLPTKQWLLRWESGGLFSARAQE